MQLVGTETTLNLDGEPVGTDGRLITLRAIDEARRIVMDKAKMDGIAAPTKAEEEKAGPMRIEIVGVDPSELI